MLSWEPEEEVVQGGGGEQRADGAGRGLSGGTVLWKDRGAT